MAENLLKTLKESERTDNIYEMDNPVDDKLLKHMTFLSACIPNYINVCDGLALCDCVVYSVMKSTTGPSPTRTQWPTRYCPI